MTPRRILAGIGGALIVCVLALFAAAFWLLPHLDLASRAAAYASWKLDRQVTIGSLRVTPHLTPDLDLGIALSDVSVANIDGAATPVMATLRHLTATLGARSLLSGPLQIRTADLDGLVIRLERGAGRVPNWRFGTRAAPRGPDPAPLSQFPSLRTVTLKDGALIYRTLSGKELTTRFDTAAIATAADDQPVKLDIAGAYNGTPLSLDADLASLVALRATPRPYPAALRFASGEARLTFEGTMTAPLHVDGASGTLDLAAPDPAPLYAIAGFDGGPGASLFLTGPFQREGPLWRLSDSHGSLQTSEVLKATIALTDAPPGQPDKVALDLAFDALDINDIMGSGTSGKRTGADMPLVVERAPGTLVTARATAKSLYYAAITATDVVLDGAVELARISFAELALTTFGTRVRASGSIEPPGGTDAAAGGHVVADVQATGADVQTLRRELGFGAIPLTGRLDMQLAFDATAATLNAAMARARISGVASMRGGAVEKSIVQMGSTDIRALFGASRGTTAVSCLLLGLDMRAGAGTVAPLRLRSAEGTIAGSATFNLNRRTVDLTVGSDARTTGLFALDIPVRVTGPFASPAITPGQWTPQGRALLAAASDLSRLPPALQAFARRNPCQR